MKLRIIDVEVYDVKKGWLVPNKHRKRYKIINDDQLEIVREKIRKRYSGKVEVYFHFECVDK
jgi:hypothetical protein